MVDNLFQYADQNIRSPPQSTRVTLDLKDKSNSYVKRAQSELNISEKKDIKK